MDYGGKIAAGEPDERKSIILHCYIIKQAKLNNFAHRGNHSICQDKAVSFSYNGDFLDFDGFWRENRRWRANLGKYRLFYFAIWLNTSSWTILLIEGITLSGRFMPFWRNLAKKSPPAGIFFRLWKYRSKPPTLLIEGITVSLEIKAGTPPTVKQLISNRPFFEYIYIFTG